MSIWKWVGAAAGGVGGFLVGGPAGAAAGASLGYSAGASADESNAQSDAAAANAAAAQNVKVDPNAWKSQPGLMSQTPGTSQDLQWYDKEISSIDDGIANLKKQLDALPPGDPRRDTIQHQIDILTGARNNYSGQRQAEQQRINQRDQTDAMQSLDQMRAAQARTAPTLDRTIIQETNPDFSAANSTLAGSADFRNRQLSEADALLAGKGGEGQQALIDRLNNDLNGKGPSLAQLQLEEGRDAAINDAASIANSARGNTMAMSQLEALRSSQRSIQDTSRSAAMLRAQEYAKAREEMAAVLQAKRAQELQGYNIASTELGQGRGQDISTAGIQSQNALSTAQIQQATRLAQANLDQDTKNANLLAYFKQQGLNQEAAEFWADKYTHYQERPQDLAIDYQKTNAGIASDIYHTTVDQNNANLDRQQRRDAAIAQGIATAGTSLATSGTKGGTGGGGVGGGAPGTPAPAPQQSAASQENSGTGQYSNPYGIIDPWKNP